MGMIVDSEWTLAPQECWVSVTVILGRDILSIKCESDQGFNVEILPIRCLEEVVRQAVGPVVASHPDLVAVAACSGVTHWLWRLS